MAVPNDGQRVASNWQLVVKDKPEDQIHTDYWLFNQMSEGNGFVGRSGGDYISSPIEYALNSTVQNYSDTDTFSTARVDVFDRYEYQWKETVGTIVMSALEEDRNSGEGQIFALMPAKLENLRNSIRQRKNSDMYGDGTGDGGKAPDGLGNLISTTPTTGTVGGINRANFSFWRNQQTAGTQSVSAFDTLRSAMRTIYNRCSNGVGGKHPSFGVTDQTSFEGYESLLVANERFTSKADGDGGFKNENLKFKGMMLAYDAACTAGNMYFANPEFLKIFYKTGSWMKAIPGVRPANQTVDIIPVRSMWNLIAVQPRRLGVVSAIS